MLTFSIRLQTLVLIILISFSANGCDNDSTNTVQEEDRDSTYFPNSYFPISLGNSWTYNDGKTVTVTIFADSAWGVVGPGEYYARITNDEPGSAKGNASLYLKTTEVRNAGSSNSWFVLSRQILIPDLILKFPLSTGSSWTETGYTNNYEINYYCEVMSENQTVEIGDDSYENCVQLRITLNYPNGFNNTPYPIIKDFYFYSGIGCIKRLDQLSDSTEIIYEVVSYEIK